MFSKLAGAACALLLAGSAHAATQYTYTYTGAPFTVTPAGSAFGASATLKVTVVAQGARPARGQCTDVTVLSVSDGLVSTGVISALFQTPGFVNYAQVCASSAGMLSLQVNVNASPSNSVFTYWEILVGFPGIGGAVGDTAILNAPGASYSGSSATSGKLKAVKQ